jgi:putative transposase
MDKFQHKYRIQSHRKPNWDYSANGQYFLTMVTQHRDCNLGAIVMDTNGLDTHGLDTHGVDTHGRAYQQYNSDRSLNNIPDGSLNNIPDGSLNNESNRATMILSDFGIIVETEWYKSFEIRDELFLDEFIIMPNHIHAIVILKNQSVSISPLQSATPQTPLLESLPTVLNETIKRNPAIRLPKSISSFIAGFKSAVNTKIDDLIDEKKLNQPKYNRNNHFFQPDYYDHIITNELEYHRIKNCIIHNPQNW